MKIFETKTKTTTYSTNNNFFVDIVEKGGNVEAWLYNGDYGVKSLMFGVVSSDFSLDLVENNIEEEVQIYKDFYMKDIF